MLYQNPKFGDCSRSICFDGSGDVADGVKKIFSFIDLDKSGSISKNEITNFINQTFDLKDIKKFVKDFVG